MGKTVTGIPKTERIWVTHKNLKGETFYITSKETRDSYFLYRVENDRVVRLGKSKSPLELEQKYFSL